MRQRMTSDELDIKLMKSLHFCTPQNGTGVWARFVGQIRRNVRYGHHHAALMSFRM